jgi:thiamine phosphate synthase YjbQ (UPF0047 family)
MSFKLHKSCAGLVVSEQTEPERVLADMVYFIRDNAPDKISDVVDAMVDSLVFDEFESRESVVANLVDTELVKILAEIAPDGSMLTHNRENNHWSYAKIMPTHIICVYLSPNMSDKLRIPVSRPIVWTDALDFCPDGHGDLARSYIVAKLKEKSLFKDVDLAWGDFMYTFLESSSDPIFAI